MKSNIDVINPTIIYTKNIPRLRLTSGIKLVIVCDCPGTKRDGISIIWSFGYGTSRINIAIPAAKVTDHHGFSSIVSRK